MIEDAKVQMDRQSKSRAEAARPYLPPLGDGPSLAAPANAPASPSLASLRNASRGPRQLSAVSLPPLKQSDFLLPLEPSVDRERLKPASFANVKALQRHPMAFPKHELRPARLVTRASVAAAPSPAEASRPAAAAIPAPPMTPAPPAPATPSEPFAPQPFLPPSDLARPAVVFNEPAPLTKSQSEPLWHQLFAPDKAGARGGLNGEAEDAPHYSRQISDSGFDWGDAGGIEFDGLPESKSNIEPLADEQPKRIWFWQAIEGVFLSRAFSGALAAMMVVLFVGTIDVPWNEWVRRQAGRVRNPIVSAMNQLSRPIEERAAFFIIDDFSSGLDNWSGARSIQVDPAGWLKVSEGFSLNESTVGLQDYRLDFDAKIQAQAVGWSVRTLDENTYYGFKLLQGGSDRAPEYSLSRFSVIDGVKSSVSQRIDVPAHLARADDFNRISVRVVKDQITTLVNGWGVDFWRDDRLPKGGVGLLADAGESALVRKMTVSGNDDTWGLILYGTLETMHSVEDFFDGSSAPAAVFFYRPPTPARVFRLSGE